VCETFLTYLQCPECRGGLESRPLSTGDDLSLEEELRCRSCCRSYPVEEEVPNLLLDGKQGDEKRMRTGFEFEWKHFSRREKPYLTQIALEWVRPLCPEDFAGRVVLDAGCGMGRNTRVFSSLGPKVIIGFDLHDGVKLAARLCRDQPNALFAKADLFRPPLRPLFDVIVSIGVLHHTPDPGAAFHSLAMLLKPGGRIAAFIYSQQRERLIMRTVTALRQAVFSRVPRPLLLVFCYALGCLLYPVIFWLYPAIEKGGETVQEAVAEAASMLDRAAKRHLRFDALRGVELVPGVSRLCAMNLFLHGVGPDDDSREPPIRTDDALRDEPGDHFDVVVTNPPFGKKSSITVVNEEGETDRETLTYNRPDFWTTTSNKQLNFVQHVKSLLKIHGRAAVVVPDNVLFEGGAGETVRRKLLHECDVHTLLRLPTGIFYAQGVKANVAFFDRKPGAKEPWTRKVWVYDLRTNKHFTLKTRRMSRADLDEFVGCYKPGERQKRKATWSEKNPEGRWRPFGYDEIVARDKVSLDLFWLRDESLEDSANLPDPNTLAQEIADDLRSALGQIEGILGDLEQRAVRHMHVE